MKPIIRFTTPFAILLACVSLAGCSIIGKNPKPPSPLESGIFNVTTNYVPVVVPVTEYRTNTVQVTQTVTNTQGVIQSVITYLTNTVPVTTYQTNIVQQYAYANGPGAQTAQTVAGTIGALFGAGGITTTAVSALLALWGYLRSSKNYATAANTAQLVEVLRQFVKSLPNGAAYDAALTQFMTQHQSEAGVLANVVQILANDVSNPDAKVAAASLIASLRQLGIVIPTDPNAPKV